MGLDFIHKLLAVNLLAEFCFRQRVQGRRKFVCRGRIQLSLAKDAMIQPPANSCYIGMLIFGNSVPKNLTTVIVCSSQSTLSLKEGVCIGRGATLSVAPRAKLGIGEDTSVGHGSRIFASTSIQIGQRCAISFGVTILDDDGHGFGLPPYSAPVCIEDDVWIGCNVTILKGVTIGKGTVVAAGAVVSRSCPPYSLIAGVPAEVIREGVLWTDADRLRQEALKTNQALTHS